MAGTPMQTYFSQSFAVMATAALIERYGTLVVARGIARSVQMVRNYAKLAADGPWPAHIRDPPISPERQSRPAIPLASSRRAIAGKSIINGERSKESCNKTFPSELII